VEKDTKKVFAKISGKDVVNKSLKNRFKL